ncbi:hypothetical protein PGT21_005014 [Puccinia graminis f. sp. tritici]|uniref:Uncharacterized protein n=1 Tax=Puccinia graminis f. sp. tritici TaxID=56615 RepID=A0A5B0S827_PUCGR|nr:hypothetical protein PGT21_005014 [Puccinia graminis f. sp. tritici]KAA1133615.1 hypothetical protein PGTUg99_027891 [Puccinia graminis f. sp. tritici]
MSIFTTGLFILALACLLSVVEGECSFRCHDGVSRATIGMCVTLVPDPTTGQYGHVPPQEYTQPSPNEYFCDGPYDCWCCPRNFLSQGCIPKGGQTRV